MTDLIIKKGNEIPSSDNSFLLKEFNEKFFKNRSLIAANLTDILSGYGNIKDIINPEKVYVAKFSKDVLMKIEAGQYEIMKDKHGEILSTIIDKTLPKNKNIVHQLRMEEIDPNLNNKIKNLETNVTNIAIQQQLAEVTQMLVQIQTTVLEIKRGQMNDRIGLILSGRNQLEQALRLKDADPNKKGLIMSSIQSINNGRAQLDLALREEINKKIHIPDNKLMLVLQSLFNLYRDIEEQYSSIQEGMCAYFEATRLLTLAYTVIDSKEALQTVLGPAIKIVELSHDKMKLMSPYILEGESASCDYWYDNPEKLLEQLNISNQFNLPQDIENISIEFRGNELFLEEGSP